MEEVNYSEREREREYTKSPSTLESHKYLHVTSICTITIFTGRFLCIYEYKGLTVLLTERKYFTAHKNGHNDGHCFGR